MDLPVSASPTGPGVVCIEAGVLPPTLLEIHVSSVTAPAVFATPIPPPLPARTPGGIPCCLIRNSSASLFTDSPALYNSELLE